MLKEFGNKKFFGKQGKTITPVSGLK